jgi:hypothetical protein
MVIFDKSHTPREMFRWAFQEQCRSREVFKSPLDVEPELVEVAAMDAFDYTLKRFGLDQLDIRPGRP